MSAKSFQTIGIGDSAGDAFDAAVSAAKAQHGAEGFTGSIAEKTYFTVITAPPGINPHEFANKLFEEDDPRVGTADGPCGAIKINKTSWLFVGWANA